MEDDLRTRKRAAMRESISDVATKLFSERGFDNVTIDQIAAAADVGRKTVFNYFPRKESLFFDREDEIRAMLLAVISHRDPAIDVIEAYRLFAHDLVRQKSPYVTFGPESIAFIETIVRSEALKAKARALRDEMVQFMTEILSQDFLNEINDSDAFLLSNLLVTTWAAARIQAHRAFLQSSNAAAAESIFLRLIDKGIVGVKATMTGTIYVDRVKAIVASPKTSEQA